MKAEKQRKSVEFIEEDENFVRQLSKDIGCYYRKTNKITFNLSTSETRIPGKVSIFAWVHKGEKDCFWVVTKKSWLDEARNISRNTHFPPNIQDGDCISLDARDNYNDTVRVLKLLNKEHSIKGCTA
jgi:hypothetical protein